MLLALVLAQRAQTLSLMTLSGLTWLDEKVLVAIRGKCSSTIDWGNLWRFFRYHALIRIRDSAQSGPLRPLFEP